MLVIAFVEDSAEDDMADWLLLSVSADDDSDEGATALAVTVVVTTTGAAVLVIVTAVFPFTKALRVFSY